MHGTAAGTAFVRVCPQASISVLMSHSVWICCEQYLYYISTRHTFKTFPSLEVRGRSMTRLLLCGVWISCHSHGPSLALLHHTATWRQRAVPGIAERLVAVYCEGDCTRYARGCATGVMRLMKKAEAMKRSVQWILRKQGKEITAERGNEGLQIYSIEQPRCWR